MPESALHEQTNGNGTHKVGPCELEKYEPTPGEAATCDPKYWSCPGSNGLKVCGLLLTMPIKYIPFGCCCQDSDVGTPEDIVDSAWTIAEVVDEGKPFVLTWGRDVQVRGANYLKDKKKILAEEPRFTLAATDLLWVDTPTLHVARFLPSLRYGKLRSMPL